MTRAIGHFLIYWKKEAFMQKGTCHMPKKQKKFLSLLFLSSLLLLLVACGKSTNSPIVAINSETEYEEVVTQDAAYLYFGFDDCPYCKEFRPILEEKLTETGQTAYYYNTKKRVNDTNYDEVLDTYGVDFVPLLIKLEDGKSVGSVNLDTVADLPALLAE
jgi:predicted bacteriocin transport accessory protein